MAECVSEEVSGDIAEEAAAEVTGSMYHGGRSGLWCVHEIERALRDGDHSFALRLVGEYAGACLAAGRVELTQAPRIDDADYVLVLAGISRWVGRITATKIPGWVLEMRASPHPIFPAERLHPVTEPMKELIRSQTPAELAGLNVWIRERDLAQV